MTLIAKPVIPQQYWIITDGKEKKGNVQAQGSGYEVSINGKLSYFKDTSEIESLASIKFQHINKNVSSEHLDKFNVMTDIKRKIEIYTKEEKSKCYYANGCFVLKLDGNFTAVLNPKYILIQRYEWYGPFASIDLANNFIKNKND